MNNHPNQEKVVIALRKAKSSLEKILRSVEKGDAECFAAITQNLATIGLLKSANLLMLESHIDRELGGKGGASPKRLQAFRDEILRIVRTSQNK